jgi:hypothetical protein
VDKNEECKPQQSNGEIFCEKERDSNPSKCERQKRIESHQKEGSQKIHVGEISKSKEDRSLMRSFEILPEVCA